MRDRLLIRHFLRRLLDHDLISPHADRHEVLTVGVAALVTSSLFITILLGLPYLFMPFQSPGRTAVLAVTDRLLYSGWSMVVMALVAVAHWEALTVDGRDASILGPLPIPHRAIVRSKLVAVGMFAVGVAVALNGVPSLLHPTLMVGKLSVGFDVLLTLVAAHAVATMAAGAFGFLTVLGLRELLRAVLGAVRFARISVLVQAGLVLGLVAIFLLLPSLSADIAGRWLPSGRSTPFAMPFAWFAGLHELLAGSVIDRLPRGPLPGFALGWETEALTLYQSQQPPLQELGRIAVAGLGLIAAIAPSFYVWNGRRLPGPVVVQATRRGHGPGVAFAWMARRVVVRDPVTQAGFFFTLQVLSGSVPHRLALAASLAVGVAVATTILRGSDVTQTVDVASVPTGFLAIQTLLLIALLAGFRHAVRPGRTPSQLDVSSRVCRG